MNDGYIPNNKNNYHVSSRATVWIARKTCDDPLTYAKKVSVGNVNSANLSPELTKLEHSSHFKGFNKKDQSIVTEAKATISVEIDEIVKDNLRYALLGGDLTIKSISVPLQDVKTFSGGPPETIVVNSGEAISSIIAIYSLTGDEYGEGPTNDYTAELLTGTITRVDSGLITSGQKVIVAYEVTETNVKSIRVMEESEIEAKVWIVSYGKAAGPSRYIHFPEVKITPTGDINLLTKDAYDTVTLELELLEDPDNAGFGEWVNFLQSA